MGCSGRYLLLVSFLLSPLFQEEATAQFVQQGNKLIGAGAVGSARQGWSVSLSSDGNTAIVGGPYDNSSIFSTVGAAWIFKRSGGQWSQQAKLVGVGNPVRQGCSVSLSSDGNTAIVGGYDESSFAGAVWVFTRSAGLWSEQANLVGTGSVGNSALGFSVSLSSDGNIAIVGGPYDSAGAGAVWIFTRSNGLWNQQAKLVGTGAVGHAVQGWSVSLSSDGNTAIVGGHGDDAGRGAAWIFTRSNGLWNQQTKLVGIGAAGSAHQGYSVSLSSDGNTAIVGGPSDSAGGGAVWVFIRSGGLWSQQGSKLVGTGTGPAGTEVSQGSSVSVSSSGNTALVGGPYDNNHQGAVWVFVRSGGVWTQQGNKLVGTGGVGGSLQGHSVSLSSNGSIVIVGGPDDEYSAPGAAWVYVQPGVGVRADNPDVPHQFDLEQNYPNPFNPSTTIRYGLPHKSAVQLTVFNTLGQQVALLQNGEQETGYHEVKFDGTCLSSGVYFYRIQAGEFIRTKSMLVVK